MQHSNTIKTTRRANAEAAVNLTRRRAWFAEGDDATPADNGGSGSGERMLAQSEVDRIVKERVKRARETAAEAERQRLLGELDIDDVATAKQLLAQAKSGGADVEKVKADFTAQIAALQAERDDAVKKLTDAEAARKLDKRNTGLTRLATTAKAINAEDVLLLAEKLAPDALKAALNEAGDFVEAEGQKVIDAVKAARPDYFKPAPGSPSNAGGRAPTSPNAPAKETPRFNL